MNRLQQEHDYWEENSKDPNVLNKYISDTDTPLPVFNGKTLDIGCGIGRLMKPGYCGIDISEGMLEIARRNHPDCEFKLTDGRVVPYPDNYFDNVYSVLLFQHLPLDGVTAYINEAHRVLKPNGQFIFQYIPHQPRSDEGDFSQHHYRGTIESLLKGFRGFRVEIMYHPSWEWVFVNKK